MNAYHTWSTWYQVGGTVVIGLLGIAFTWWYLYLGGGRR